MIEISAGQIYEDRDSRVSTRYFRVERMGPKLPVEDWPLCQRVRRCEPTLGCMDGWFPVGNPRYIAAKRLTNAKLFHFRGTIR